MSLFEAIILGLVQGLTEFIPVSSSGHLILVRELFGFSSINDLAFDATLQLATVLGVFVYFSKDLLRLIQDKQLLGALILGTIPAILLGFPLESYMETIFRNSHIVAAMLILGAGLMYLAEKFATQNKELTPGRGLVIGLFQSLALIPGVSRSGATISGGLLSGLTREAA